MFKYFDKDFFKFFWSFVAIIILSLILIIIGKLFQEKGNLEGANITNTQTGVSN